MAIKKQETIRIESVSAFVDYVMTWTRNGQPPVAFRGQSYSAWKTLPKIFRPDVGLYDHEKQAVRDLVSIHPGEFRDDRTMFDRLVRMQHFGLPTRLMDVTLNPLVALFFAADDYYLDGSLRSGKVQATFIPDNRQKYYDGDRVSCMANMANLTIEEKRELAAQMKLPVREFNAVSAVKKLVWYIQEEKPHFVGGINPSDLQMPIFVKPKLSNQRIIAQSGAFILYGARRITPSVIRDDLRIKTLLIPAECKASIRDQLERLGVHASTMFPEIDKAAALITKRYASRASSAS